MIPVKKVPQERKTGIRSIPAGIGNLRVSVSGVVIIIVEDIVVDVRSEDCHVLGCIGGHGSVRKSQPHVHCLLLVSEFSFHKETDVFPCPMANVRMVNILAWRN